MLLAKEGGTDADIAVCLQALNVRCAFRPLMGLTVLRNSDGLMQKPGTDPQSESTGNNTPQLMLPSLRREWAERRQTLIQGWIPDAIQPQSAPEFALLPVGIHVPRTTPGENSNFSASPYTSPGLVSPDFDPSLRGYHPSLNQLSISNPMESGKWTVSTVSQGQGSVAGQGYVEGYAQAGYTVHEGGEALTYAGGDGDIVDHGRPGGGVQGRMGQYIFQADGSQVLRVRFGRML
jgi:hypothetical protein